MHEICGYEIWYNHLGYIPVDCILSTGKYAGQLCFKRSYSNDQMPHLTDYNQTKAEFYALPTSIFSYGKNIKIVHFIGAQKPWHHTFNIASRRVEPSSDSGHNHDFLQLWWDIFMQYVQPHLDPQLVSKWLEFEFEVCGLEFEFCMAFPYKKTPGLFEPRTCLTEDFSLQICWKYNFVMIQLVAIRSQQNFTHATTAVLS